MTAYQRQHLANAGFGLKDIEMVDNFLTGVAARKHEGYINIAITLRKHLPDLIKCELEQRRLAQRHHTPPVGGTDARRPVKVLWKQPHPMQKHVPTLDNEALPFSDTELKAMVADGIRDSVRAEINRLKGRVD